MTAFNPPTKSLSSMRSAISLLMSLSLTLANLPISGFRCSMAGGGPCCCTGANREAEKLEASPRKSCCAGHKTETPSAAKRPLGSSSLISGVCCTPFSKSPASVAIPAGFSHAQWKAAYDGSEALPARLQAPSLLEVNTPPAFRDSEEDWLNFTLVVPIFLRYHVLLI